MRLLFAALAVLPAFAYADIHYRLTPETAARGVRVQIQVPEAAEQVEFRIPAWCPGFYFILNYQDKISDVVATTPEGERLTIERPDPRVWRAVNPAGGPVHLSYRVLGDDPGLGFFGVSVHPHTVFVNGPAAFMYVEGRKNERSTLDLQLPQGWNVATGMDQENGRYVSADYDEFIDHPLQLGTFEKRTFEAGGISFEAIYVSTDNTFRPNLDQQTERFRRISLPALRMFGGAPFDRYVYILHLATGGFMGGLEHRASTVMAMPNMPRLWIDELAAHEFFHVWNVKHIRPKVLGPFDYTQPNRTRNLWFVEGVTDYYAKLHTYQSGLRDQDYLLDAYTGDIRELQNSKNRLKMTIEEVSWNTWEHGGFGVGDLSYYTKGCVMGLILDADIRARTKGDKSLDDVMRHLFKQHRLPQPGYEEDGLLKAINEVTGQDFTTLYDRMARSTQELPYELLKGIGLRLRIPGDRVPSVGFAVDGDLIVQVAEGHRQALRDGDRFVRFGTEMGGLRPGDRFSVVVDRGGVQQTLQLMAQVNTASNYLLEIDPFATAEARQRRTEWLARPQ
jgi:predicted metalloprotease with PDZ domain